MFEDIVSTFTRLRPAPFSGEVVPCNLCGSAEHDVVGRRDRYGNRLVNVLCKACGLVFVNPMPTEERVADFYREEYRTSYHNAYTPRKKAILRAKKGAFLRHVHIAPVLKTGDRVLDVGSGGGEFVRYMCEKGFDAHGIDPNEGFVDYARRTYGVPIQIATWQTARLKDESFDVITANHVVEHFRDPYAAIRRFHSWLGPEGRMFLSVPSIANPNRTPYGRFHFGHLYNFTYETLAMLARRAGFIQSEETPERSTALIFNKAEPTEEWQLFPDHYAEMRDFFDTYTNRRYFLSPTPYFRWVHRMKRLGGDMIMASVTRRPTK
jgi:2-polyprenyl-3-methyl-5-hydroxy-6-metoxy-1,4-benzoquinol methylase